MEDINRSTGYLDGHRILDQIIIIHYNKFDGIYMSSQDCDRLFTAISVLAATFPTTGISGSRTEVLFNTWGKFQSSRANAALQSELHNGKG